MRYLILIYSNESQDMSASKEQMDAIMDEYNAYTGDLGKSGFLIAGEALQPTTTATTVRVQEGKKVTTHGPFAETKEQLGGYYLINVNNLDEAIEWAARCPGAKYGSIEVRPVMEFPQTQDQPQAQSQRQSQ